MKNQVAIITGANGGLGGCVTRAFLDAGARVSAATFGDGRVDFEHPSLAEFQTDFSQCCAAASLVQKTLEKWGRVDALIHLAGGFAGGNAITKTDDATLERMLDLNVRGAFRVIRAVLPPMQSQRCGRILAIGSRAAVEPQALTAAYSASKAALVALIRSVAVETYEFGISANILLPGTMDTPANRAANPDADRTKWVPPRQIADLLLHLASDRASHVNGAVIPVFGRDLQ
jgi:NAD(P)-dependent dehydrogenase (short-subunit alcohol dehydrogenase family)